MVTITEMARNRAGSLCCGAGGGHAWMEEEGTRVNHFRAKEAVETGAQTVGTGCPFCLQMMEDGVKAAEADVRVRDIVEIVLEALEETGPHTVLSSRNGWIGAICTKANMDDWRDVCKAWCQPKRESSPSVKAADRENPVWGHRGLVFTTTSQPPRMTFCLFWLPYQQEKP